MGWNSTLMICNDSLHKIEEDPDFGRKVAEAMCEWQSTHESVDISSCGHANAATFLGTYHADIVAVYSIGGNYGSLLSTCSNGNNSHHKREDQIRILKNITDELGYVLHKKPRKRNITDK